MGIPEKSRVVALLNDDDHEKGDNEEFWGQVQDHLRLYHGWEVRFFTDDKAFLEFVLTPGVNVDAAATDLHLKFTGGRQLLATPILDKIREETSPLPDDFPLIVMTNLFTYENEILCKDHGASDVIPKFEVRPESREISHRADGFANLLHSTLTKLVGICRGTSGRYYHFNKGWMFDRETTRLTDPSNVVVPLTWRGIIILEKFLARPGQVLTPGELGVETGHSENKVLSAVVKQCRKAIHAYARDTPATARALEEFVGELGAGNTEDPRADEAVLWLARLATAGPVFDAVIPAAQEGTGCSEELSAAELKNCLVRPVQAAPDAAGRKEIITEFAQACRRCRGARTVIGNLDPEVIEAATEPLKEFYGSAHRMAERLGPGKREQMIDGLYGRFFCHLFPDLPEPESDHESGFTVKNLRQRVIPDLRRALGDTDRSRPLISNVHNQGYCFEAAVEGSDSDRNRSWWTWLR